MIESREAIVPALELSSISKSFGDFQAVSNVSLTVAKGGRHAVLGPNGAGKSTLFNLVGGQTRPTAGKVFVDGVDLTGQPPQAMWAHGLTRTFQRNQLFNNLSVRRNLALAAMRPHIARAFRLLTPMTEIEESVSDILHRVGLAGNTESLVRDLAYGQQRQLEIALALVGRPKLLLLDEPTAGISPVETDAMLRILSDLPRSITIVIVEHDMDVVFALCDRITVLHLGEKLAEGTPSEIAANADVRRIYMGGTE
jgi:branched-chain amino acid transport system ATP-binding protein